MLFKEHVGKNSWSRHCFHLISIYLISQKKKKNLSIYLLIQVYLQCRFVFRGGSIAIFMFAYGLYFYARANARISMNLIVFLGYNACIFYAVFLMLGTIGFYASSIGFHCMGRVLKRRWLKSSILSHVDPKRDNTSFWLFSWLTGLRSP